jgi:hypothetical protein
MGVYICTATSNACDVIAYSDDTNDDINPINWIIVDFVYVEHLEDMIYM